MGFLGNLERALGVWYKDPDFDPDDTNPETASAFRSYVIKRLGSSYSCAEREPAVLGRPDLLALRNSDDMRFDIITCYRSQMFVGEDGEAYLPWTTDETLAEYKKFAETEGFECYLILGLHGFADEPKFVFSIPLKRTSIDLKKSLLSHFEVPKDKNLI
ncbi:MAG TPA: hypothetical protein O0W90_01120 [Methanocorpusculum sp.]|nr:hypothetical protein [Methanocorpusculum sp.]